MPTLTRTLSLFLYETTPAFFGDRFFLRGRDAYRAEMARIREPGLQAQIRGSEQAATARAVLAEARRNLKLLADGGVTIAWAPTAARSSAAGRATSSTWRSS